MVLRVRMVDWFSYSQAVEVSLAKGRVVSSTDEVTGSQSQVTGPSGWQTVYQLVFQVLV